MRLTGRVARMGHVKFIQNLAKREGIRPLTIYSPRYRWKSDNEMIRRDFSLGTANFMPLAQHTAYW